MSSDASGTLPPALVVLSGPTAVGKTTVGDHLLAADPGLTRVVTATTRAPRAGEVAGRDYLFLSDAEFRAGIERGDFLEYAEVHGKFYGTPRQSVVHALRAGTSVLLIIDVDGAMQVRKLEPDTLLLFLLPPDDSALEQRIRGRGTESEEAILRRLARVRRELTMAEHYDQRIVNDDLAACVASVADAIRAHQRALAARIARGERVMSGVGA